MSAPLAILWFVAVLMFLVFIHELGHFLTAKWKGVKVLEFGIGMPPRIWGKQRGETMYSLNWIPIGGFCKMLGEEDPSETGSLASKSPSNRLLVLSAGSLVMLIFPLILFTIVYMVPTDVPIGGEDVTISKVVEESPAHEAGLLEDDLILSMDGTTVKTFDDLIEITNENLGSYVTLLVERDSEQLELSVKARTEEERPEDQGAMGIGLYYSTIFYETQSDPPWTAFGRSATNMWELTKAMKELPSAFASAFSDEPKVGGVVAGGHVTTEIAEEATWEQMAFWAGALSFTLAVVNLLPLPALDGGRIIFVLIEIARRGRRVAPETEGKIHLVGFVLLLGFIFLVTYHDIARIFRGESLLP